MKKFLLTTSALILGMSISTSAMAECNGIYLAGRGGTTKHDYSHSNSSSDLNLKGLDKSSLMLSGALGYRYDYFRVEAEYVYRDKTTLNHGLSKENFKTYSMMLNGYFDFAPFHWVSPFVNAGIGYTKLKYSDAYSDGTTGTANGSYNPTRFTWSVGGGLTLKVTNRFNVDAGYRYFDMGSIRSIDVTDNEFYGGIRYVF